MDSVSVVGLAMKGELLLELGKRTEALVFIQQALESDVTEM